MSTNTTFRRELWVSINAKTFRGNFDCLDVPTLRENFECLLMQKNFGEVWVSLNSKIFRGNFECQDVPTLRGNFECLLMQKFSEGTLSVCIYQLLGGILSVSWCKNISGELWVSTNAKKFRGNFECLDVPTLRRNFECLLMQIFLEETLSVW